MTLHLLPESIPALFAAWRNADEGDTHLVHVIRMALRHQLTPIEDFLAVAKKLPAAARDRLTTFSGLVGTEAASSFASANKSGANVPKPDAQSAKERGTHLPELLSGSPTVTQDPKKIIQSRRQLFIAKGGIAEQGSAVFQTYCAVCHQLGGEGGDLGPSLDGIGNRGLDRLLEDLLDPDRIIDPAFSMTNITTKGGQAFSGIGLYQEGENMVLTDATGKRRSIPKQDIQKQETSNLSIMPAALTQAIPEGDFADLLEFLLGQK